MRDKLDRKAFVLLLLFARGPGGEDSAPIRGRTRLAKLLFLLKEEQWAKAGLGRLAHDFYSFEPDSYGPFDRNVHNDIDFLRAIGFVDVRNLQPLPGDEVSEYHRALSEWSLDKDLVDETFLLEERYIEQELRLTETGRRFVEQRLVPRLGPGQLEAFEFVKTQYGSWTLGKLLRYIYATYPAMAAQSKIRARVLRGLG